MNHCSHCNMDIMDDTIVCPFCRTVMDYGIKDKSIIENFGNKNAENDNAGNENAENKNAKDKDAGNENARDGVAGKPYTHFASLGYPKIDSGRIKWSVLLNFFILAAVLCEGILIVINILTFNGCWWSIICGGAIAFSYISLRNWTRNYSGNAINIIVELFSSIALSILVDYVLGYRGWSVNYAIPCSIMLSEAAVMVLMILFFQGWQRYLSILLLDMVFSLFMLIMIPAGIVTWPVLSFIAAGVSIIMFLAALIVGGRKAENELKRKFRI